MFCGKNKKHYIFVVKNEGANKDIYYLVFTLRFESVILHHKRVFSF